MVQSTIERVKTGPNMLSPRDIHNIDDLTEFKVRVHSLKIGETEPKYCDVRISYDEKARILLHLGEHCENAFGIFGTDASIKYSSASKECPIFISRQWISTTAESPVVEARLKTEPLTLCETETASRFEAIIINPPQFISNEISLIDTYGNCFQIQPRNFENGSTCFVEGTIAISHKNWLEKIQTLVVFLTFLKGSHCGIGHLFAYAQNSDLCFRALGFSRSDRDTRQTNWFDIEVQNALPEIFSKFSKATSDETTLRALRQTIDFYRASNASRDVSLEMSIISAHSALESIVNYVLSFRAGWSSALLENKSAPFSDKSRAAAFFFGVGEDLLSYSPYLKQLSSRRNNIDAFEIISLFRNKLVHQDKKFIPTGPQLHEIWLVTQWLIEVLVFKIIGFEGEIIDRRRYGDWRGTTCKIP